MIRIIVPYLIGVLIACGLVIFNAKLREKSLLSKVALTVLAGVGIGILINAGLEVLGLAASN